MDIKRLGNPAVESVMLLHGNLMCWRQFEDLIRCCSGVSEVDL